MFDLIEKKTYTVFVPTTTNGRGSKVFAVYNMLNEPVNRSSVEYEDAYTHRKTYYVLADNIHQWFIDYNIEYEIDFGFNDWLIIMTKVEHAVLFKLIWS